MTAAPFSIGSAATLRRRWLGVVAMLSAAAIAWAAIAYSFVSPFDVKSESVKVDGPFEIKERRSIGCFKGSVWFQDKTLSWKRPSQELVASCPPEALYLLLEPRYAISPHAKGMELELLGFRFRRRFDHQTTAFHRDAGELFVAVPFWFAAVVVAFPSIALLRREYRWRARAAQGRCRACGYDLRVASDLCPECGVGRR